MLSRSAVYGPTWRIWTHFPSASSSMRTSSVYSSFRRFRSVSLVASPIHGILPSRSLKNHQRCSACLLLDAVFDREELLDHPEHGEQVLRHYRSSPAAVA